MDDAHAPEIMSGQMNVVKTYLKARYRLSDLLRAQRNDRMTSSLKRWIENGAPDKGDLEEDSYKILKQFYLKRKDLLYLNKDGIVACKRKEEDKVLYKYNSIVLPQLYQTELLFRSHDQMGHQGVDKVYNRIQKRFEWPGLKKACEKWIAACLSCQQAKDPRKLRFPLQSIESSGFNRVAERGRNRLMRWRRGEMSGHDLAREPGLGEQRDHRLGEMPLPVQPAQPLIGAKRQRDGPGPSHSVDSPTAAPPLKRVRVSEIEIQTSETIETLEKKERDQSELCAKLQEYRTIARERDE